MGVMDTLLRVGLDKMTINRALDESVVVRAAIHEVANAVQAAWKRSAPVMDGSRKPHPIQKGSGFIIDYGDYRDSIKIRYLRRPFFYAEVYSKDPKAHWLEYGSVHNKAGHYAENVATEFGATVRYGGGRGHEGWE